MKKMFVPDVARRAGISPESVARYHSLAQASRKRAETGRPGRLPRPRDMPVPDGFGYPAGRVSGALAPWWQPETIVAWLDVRQGPGKPPKAGGPPRQITACRSKPGPKRRRLVSRETSPEGQDVQPG